MITPKQQKAFLVLLSDKRKLSLTEVISFFETDSPALEFDEILEALNNLWVENLFSVKEEGSEEEIWFEPEMKHDPGNYYLELNNYLDKDSNYSEEYQGEILEENADVFSEYYRWVETKNRGFLKVIGDLDGASNLMERIRAFSNFFAFNLTTRRTSRILPLLSEHVREIYTEDVLREKIETIEIEYGDVEYYDHIEIVSVYNGDHCDEKVSGEMKLPKGVSRKSRLGEVTFKLVTAHTPNGVSIFDYTVYLAIILEDSELKVCDLQFRAT